ncbi:MAG: DUF3592 domain-containing protein [Microscillaceae bacterium]|jgi:hypothetical protein|nr:DUF3592 domain-containing protein [Microscillaceae bacterium]
MDYNQDSGNYYQNYGYSTSREVSLALSLKVLFGSLIAQMGWFFFGFGMIFVIVFVGNADFSGFYLDANSPTAIGTVSGVEATNSSVNKRRVYAINYQFTDSQGKIQQGTSYTTGSLPNTGDQVKVQYLASKPSYSRIEGLSQSTFPIFVLFVLIFPIIGLAFVLSHTVFAIKALQLLKNGQIARGRLIKSEPTNTRINEQTVMKMTFEFVAQDGQRYEAIAKTHLVHLLTDEREEMLFYNPLRPQNAVLKDNLPGHPQVNPDGTFAPLSLAGAMPYLIIPGITIVGLGWYFWAVWR